ncbi:DNA-directed RNA polymerase subunit [Entamoeba marina]
MDEEDDAVNDSAVIQLLETTFETERKRLSNTTVTHIHTDIHRRGVVKSFLQHMAGLSNKKCPYCGVISPKIKKNDDKNAFLFIGECHTNPKDSSSAKHETTPSYVRDILQEAWNYDDAQSEVLKRLFMTSMKGGENLDKILPSYFIFFLEVLPIPPPKFRPLNRFGGMVSDHPQTIYFRTIVEGSEELAQLRSKHDSTKTEMQIILQMQKAYNQLVLSQDSTLPPSIKTTLEHKDGLFRKHMMGKRVNHAARTVISPDPFIPTNTVGIPLHFAMRLSFPTVVNERNFEDLKNAVINGPEVYPGALAIENEWGKKTLLPDDSSQHNYSKRQGEASRLLTVNPHAPRNYKIVYRHVVDNDMVLSNRQPTLHKPGIMGHYVKVLKLEKTIRMHYANCNTFNADFDGDEMNIHYPQSIQAKSEIMNIALSDEQYVVPKNGQPLRGLIQDHVISSFLLTKRDTTFTKEEFSQIIYTALYGINEEYTIHIPMPTILKPKTLWTGKQVISTILKHISTNHCTINFTGKCKVSTEEINKGGYHSKEDIKKMSQKDSLTKIWDGGNDSLCIVRNSELITGTLDKNQIGASNGGLIHCIYELYNAKVAGMCLSLFSRLLTTYLQSLGHTCSLDDCLLSDKYETKRKQMLDESDKIASDATARHFGLEGKSKNENRFI